MRSSSNNDYTTDGEKNLPHRLTDVEDTHALRWMDFAGGVWHGAFLAMAMAFASVTVVVPAFVAELTGSSVWVGGMAALLSVFAIAPQILVAHFVEPLHRKRPVLLIAIYLRAASWAALALLIGTVGSEHPRIVLGGLIGFLGLFAMGGALGNVPYTDIVGKVIPPQKRGIFFAGRQAAGSVLSVAATAIAGIVLSRPYPENFATLFMLSALSLGLSSIGIWLIREQPNTSTRQRRASLASYLRSLREPFKALRPLVMVSWATGMGWMAVPFYVVAAKQGFGVSHQKTAYFVGAVVLGALVGNLAWGWIVDRYGSHRMLLACVSVATLTPAIALLSWVVGWQALIVAAGLSGATGSGKTVGYSSALLEIAPADRRSSYAGAYAFLGLPVAFMPLLGGAIVTISSFQSLFLVTTILLIAAVGVVWRWNRRIDALK